MTAPGRKQSPSQQHSERPLWVRVAATKVWAGDTLTSLSLRDAICRQCRSGWLEVES